MPEKLHVLMPTYNRAHMLERTLSGLFKQDADPQWWHVTVVDNASTDSTVQLLERCAAQWPNLDHVVNERNLGLFGNMNRCIDLARTERYMIVHSDDDIHPNLISSVLNFLERHPDVQMCFGSCRAYIEETGEVIPHWYRSRIVGDKERVLDHRDFLSALLSSGSNFIFPPTVVYSRAFFSPDLRYSTEFRYTSDLDLWFRAALKQPRVGFIPEPLITCRIHSGRLSAKHADAMRLEALAIVRRYLALVRDRVDLHSVSSRLMSFIELKLRAIELAIRLHLIPGFKLRRLIATLLDGLTRRFVNKAT